MKMLRLLFGLISLSTPLAADVLVSSFDGDKILRYSDTGVFLQELIAPGSGGLDAPHRSRIGPDGALYVASAESNEILRYHATTGAFLGAFVSAGSGGLDYPVDMIFHTDGFLYISSQGTNQILRYDALTGLPDAGYVAFSGSLSGPSGLAIDSSGNLFAAGRFSNTIARFTLATGAFETAFPSSTMPFGLALTLDNRLLSAAGGAGQVTSFIDPSGTPVPATLVAATPFPIGLEIGPDGSLYTASYTGNALHRYNAHTGADLGIFIQSANLEGPNFFTFVVPEPSVPLLIVLAILGGALRYRKISQFRA